MLDQTLEIVLDPGAPAFELNPDGHWERVGPVGFEPHPQRNIYEWVARTQTARSQKAQ